MAGFLDPVADKPLINTSVPTFAIAAEALQRDTDQGAQAVSCRLEFLHSLYCVCHPDTAACSSNVDQK